jgi:hypothetical protein
MKSTYTLQIENPCSASWHDMSPTGTGRHCLSCHKNVLDLTRLSDSEVVVLLRKSRGEICGRLSKQQLDRPIADPVGTLKLPFAPYLAGLLFLPGAVMAVPLPQTAIEIVPTVEDSMVAPQSFPPDSVHQFKGRILDMETGEPVFSARIHMQEAAAGAKTDIDGYFQLQIPDSLIQDEMTFVISNFVYPPAEVKVCRDELSGEKELFVVFESLRSDQLQVVGAIKIHKRKWWQRKKSLRS